MTYLINTMIHCITTIEQRKKLHKELSLLDTPMERYDAFVYENATLDCPYVNYSDGFVWSASYSKGAEIPLENFVSAMKLGLL
jgi:hypothetical protein